ncbi:MAG TPA: hypothetical protein VFC30_02920 [Solirubrobacteraceae bacterium]|nr:hypothetical protein [Solirubrobacteraceae bacterium]
MRNRRLPHRCSVALALGLCTLALNACGDTLQDQPLSHTTLESLLLAPYPVYWLGGSFQGMAITEASQDPSGAFSVFYGDCAAGGQSTCVPRLRVVTSPDNSFIPVGSQPHSTVHIRHVAGVAAQGSETIELPTAGVVVGIYADSPRLAGAAAEMIVPINSPGVPAAPLPSPLPDTGFAERPLPGQAPPPLRAPH